MSDSTTQSQLHTWTLFGLYWSAEGRSHVGGPQQGGYQLETPQLGRPQVERCNVTLFWAAYQKNGFSMLFREMVNPRTKPFPRVAAALPHLVGDDCRIAAGRVPH